MKKLVIGGTLCAFLAQSSCQSETSNLDNYSSSNDSIVLSMKFKTPSQILDYSTSRASIDSFYDVNEGRNNFVICQFYWGKRAGNYNKKNRNCLDRKAHLCYTTWFSFSEASLLDLNIQESCVYSILKQDKEGKYYAELLLDEDADYNELEVPFISVAEDDSYFGTGILSSLEFTTVQGKYLLDKGLGEHGGFRIDIEINE